MSEAIVGLDIGTTTVRAVIGVFSENGELQITGVGTAPSSGLRNGAVSNIEAAMTSVKSAIEHAEMMAGHEVVSVYTAIGGAQVSSLNSTGVVGVAVNSKGTQEITQRDVDRVLEAAKSVPIDIARQIIHVIPQTYTVNGQKGIKDPVNMIGVRLEAAVHIVTAAVTSVQNLIRCIGRAGFSVDEVRLKTLASAEAITTEEERELGSIIIDLGGGSTDALVLHDGAPICSVSIPLGGATVSNDISVVRGISFDSAERIKKSSGCCYSTLLDEEEKVIIPGIGGRPPEEITRYELCSYIQPRIEEILTMEDGFKRKPDPEAINYLVDKYNLNKNFTYYVGDRHLDIDSANNAGIRSIFFKPEDSYVEPTQRETHIVYDLIEIKDIIK